MKFTEYLEESKENKNVHLEHIEDEELREYRYRNMLEDLKESIQSEDEEANRKKNHE